MDDSRSVLQAPAELPVSGQFLLPPHTQFRSAAGLPAFGFRCAVCAGTEFTVESRAGVEIELASLQIYQRVGWGDFAGTYNVYTCIRCAEAVACAHIDCRDAILGQILFASRDLANMQFSRSLSRGRLDLVCTECRRPQVSSKFLEHKESCRTGRVLRLLEALMRLEDPRGRKESLCSGAGSIACIPGAGAEMGGAQ